MQAEADLGDLLEKVATRDQAALRAIYVRQSTRLFGIAMAILRDRVAAADVLQDSFLRIWQRAGQFDPSRGEAQVWLGSIVRHAALDAVRARGREIPTDDPGLGDSMVEPDVIDSIAAADDGRRLQACLERLPAANREGIVLAFVHGLSHPEIAARLDLPLGTVKSWIRRGLLSLRECLS
jgi:RNA polymerase sigma-70 factor (ECF subfamily)